jgi:hypothetical protein
MSAQHRLGKRAWLLVCALGTSSLLALPERGQGQPAEQGEVKAVVRISKRLIAEVTSRKEVVATIPFHARVLGFHCEGVIHGRGRLSVELITNTREATFVVNGQGTAHTCVRGVLGPIVVVGPAGGPFTSRTTMQFDGRKFSRVETTPWAEVHAELERVEGRHGGPVGRAVGRVVRPLGELLIPRAEREALPIGEYYLKNFVDELAGEIISDLNRATPVEESMNRLFPETGDWGFRLSADAEFIQAAYGPRDSVVPTLPENPRRLKDVRLELWLHPTTKGAQALEQLSKQPLARQLVQTYLEATLPELAALTEERSVEAVGPWIVISIGAPRAK